MSELLIVLGIIVGGFILICILAATTGVIQRILHRLPSDISPKQVLEELQKIVDGSDRYALGDFITCGPLKDPRLEAIRQRIAGLDTEFPPESKGEYCSPKGIEIIRDYIGELECAATANASQQPTRETL